MPGEEYIKDRERLPALQCGWNYRNPRVINRMPSLEPIPAPHPFRISNLPALFQKHPGWGVPIPVIPRTQELFAAPFFALRAMGLMLSFARYDFHRHQANYYRDDVDVDYYDYVDYYRFGRVEKHLARKLEKVSNPPPKRTGGGFSI
jgi:hypothetical protein